MNQESGIYGVCKLTVMTLIYTDIIEALLNPEQSERLPFLVINDNFAYRLQLLPVDSKCGENKSKKSFLLRYTEVRHMEKNTNIQPKNKQTILPKS